MQKNQKILFCGSSNKKLGTELAKLSGLKLGSIKIDKFSDGETYVNVEEEVKGKDIFVLQSCNSPANQNLMEVLIMIDALKGLSPKNITAILPFCAYRRQEKKTKEGESVTARLVAKLFKTAGAQKIIFIDIHTDKILDFFKIPVCNIGAAPLFLKYFKKIGVKNLMVIAPDKGALKNASRFAKKLGVEASYIEKKRAEKHSQIESMILRGSVKGKNVLIIDDEIDTAGTLCKAVELLKKSGAKNIYAACTHAVFSGLAIERLKKSSVKEIVVTNTIYLDPEKIKALGHKLKILSVAPFLARAIKKF